MSRKDSDAQVPVNFAEIFLDESSMDIRDQLEGLKTYKTVGRIVVSSVLRPDPLYQKLTYVFIEGKLPFPASEMRKEDPRVDLSSTRYVYLPAPMLGPFVTMIMSAKPATLKAGNTVETGNYSTYPLFWKSSGTNSIVASDDDRKVEEKLKHGSIRAKL